MPPSARPTVETEADNILKIRPIKLRQLLLDPENPRLEGIATGTDDESLARALWREMAVDEVALSIAANGFFEEEPLFAIPDKSQKSGEPRYIVVEGNRRLTAVKLLTDDALRRKLKATDLPEISEKAKSDLLELPVSIYPDRESLWEYFGFRHVNGPKEWDSLSKAAYVVRVRRKYGVPLDEIARKIGDKHSTVERIYRGFLLLEQAETMTKFSREDRIKNRFYFSHLYTAADYAEFQQHLGVTSKSSLKDRPVSKPNLPRLEEMMTWLFGSKARDLEPVVQRQNPDLGHLRSVLGNQQSIAALRNGMRLERAYAISLGDSRRFEQALVAAKDGLHEAKGTVTTGFKGDRDLLDQMENIHSLSQSILEEMRKIADQGN